MQPSVELGSLSLMSYRHPAWRSLRAALWIWLIAYAAWLWVPIRHVSPEELRLLTEVGRKNYHPDNDLPIYLFAGTAAVLTCTRIVRKTRCCVAEPELSVALDGSSREIADRPARSLRSADLIAVVIIGLLVPVVAPGELVERGLVLDGFHHVDFYIMGPWQGFHHGKALGTDVFTQYGGGWILVYSVIESWCRIDYELFFATFPLFGVAYFLISYLALRLLIADPWWSLIGLFTGIWLQLYCGTGAPLWIYPSSTVLRCPLDMLLAIAVFKIQQDGSRGWAIVAGAAGGLSLLFGVDTGIYILVGMAVVSGLIVVQDRGCRDSVTIRCLSWIWGTAFVSLIVGMTFASRGTLADPRFWSGYFEAVIAYGSGLGALPMRDVIRQPLAAACFLTILVTYSLTLSNSIARAICRRCRPQDLMQAFLSTIGFGALTIFVNRSHPYNLYHTILPACWLWAKILAEYLPLDNGSRFCSKDRVTIHCEQRLVSKNCETEAQPITSGISLDQFRAVGQLRPGLGVTHSRRLAVALTVGVAVALIRNSNFWEYPSVITHVAALVQSTANPHTAVRDFQAEIREIASKLRSQHPDQEITVVGEDPTIWLSTLDLSPNGRYCPTIPITMAQVRSIQQDLRSIRAQTILVARAPSFHGDMMEDIVKEDFDFKSATDRYAIYVRRSSDSAH